MSEAARLASHMLVGSLIRRVEAAGGFAMVLHRGDPISGTIMLQCNEKGVTQGLFERVPDFSNGYQLLPCGPKSSGDSHDMAQHIAQYMERRRRSDPDLWLIELDIADAERFAAEILC